MLFRRRLNKPELDSEQVKRFFQFIEERHNIFLRRQAGDSWPWTKDKILQTYSFCNVFRELDTVTCWIRENFREPYANHKNLWFAMAMSRLINWHPTLEEIGFPKTWDADRVAKIMRRRQKLGKKVFTGAYILTGGLGGTKIDQTVYKILDPLFHSPPEFLSPRKDTLKSIWEQFTQRTGIGAFIAYEIVTDLRHTRYLNRAPDIMTWANAGPGAKRGIERMLGVFVHRKERTGEESRSSIDYLSRMRELLSVSEKHLPKQFPRLEMRDIEHCLCEFDKYERVRLGQGRPRAKYSPPSAQTSLL